MGFWDDGLLQHIARRVSDAFGLPALVLREAPLPGGAYAPDRDQYNSTDVLKSIDRYIPDDALRVLAVTNADLFVPMMNFVFGEAAVDGRVSLISLHRLRPEFYANSPDEQLFVGRVMKEAIHELGHTFGLRHSANPNSVMYFSSNIVDTDRKSAEFDGDEIELLASKIRELKRAA